MTGVGVDVSAIEPCGFCTGVRIAVEKARKVLSSKSKAYCLHLLVHNEEVVGELRRGGMVFVDSLEDVPRGATIMFSAHGVPPDARRIAAERGLEVVDATCPFVDRAHREVRAFAEQGLPVVVVGHSGHVEVEGLVAEYLHAAGEGGHGMVEVALGANDVAQISFADGSRVGMVCQTTLSELQIDETIAAMRRRWPYIVEVPSSASCTATRDRQRAVRDFVLAAGEGAGVLVVGSGSSSNTLRLAEVAAAAGARTWRIDGPDEIDECDFEGIAKLGVAAGASTPKGTAMEVCAVLRRGDAYMRKGTD